MDGQGTLFGVVSGNTKEVLHRVTVDLPKVRLLSALQIDLNCWIHLFLFSSHLLSIQ